MTNILSSVKKIGLSEEDMVIFLKAASGNGFFSDMTLAGYDALMEYSGAYETMPIDMQMGNEGDAEEWLFDWFTHNFGEI